MQNTAAQPKSIKWNGSSLMAGLSLVCILVLYVFSTKAPAAITSIPKLQLFKAMFISIIIEAMPFILIGVLISALLQVFVSEQMMKRMIPQNPVLGIVAASVLGILFPICECGMVPAIRRLIKKGMPLYVATTFIVVGPILNPIVFWSTFTAFRNREEITFSRMGLAFLVALVIGLIVHRFVKQDQLKHSTAEFKQPVKKGREKKRDKAQASEHPIHSERQHDHDHDGHHHPRRNRLAEVMSHSISEFFEMGKYLMFGALLVALLQTFVSKASLMALGHGQVSSHLLMMGLGFILSLCSTSDAFVAQSFVTTFSKGSLVAFMVFGPMLNLKGLLMMSAVFKTRFVILYSSLVTIFVFAGTLILEWFVLK